MLTNAGRNLVWQYCRQKKFWSSGADLYRWYIDFTGIIWTSPIGKWCQLLFCASISGPKYSCGILVVPWKIYASSQGLPNLAVQTADKLFSDRKNSYGWFNEWNWISKVEQELNIKSSENAYSLLNITAQEDASFHAPARNVFNPATQQPLAKIQFLKDRTGKKRFQCCNYWWMESQKREWKKRRFYAKPQIFIWTKYALIMKLAVLEANRNLTENAIGRSAPNTNCVFWLLHTAQLEN